MQNQEDFTLNFDEITEGQNGKPFAGSSDTGTTHQTQAQKAAQNLIDSGNSYPTDAMDIPSVTNPQTIEDHPNQSMPQDQLTAEVIAEVSTPQQTTYSLPPTQPLAYEAQAGTITNGYSWMGKESAKLHIKSIFGGKIFKYILIGLASVGIFILVFNFPLIFANLRYRFSTPTPTQSSDLQTPAITTPTAVAVEGADAVIITKLNVNVPIVYVPTLDEKQIQVGLRSGVVHYAGTALPGQDGNTVIFGHSSNDWWQPGNYKFVFALLDRLVAGDLVEVHYQQKKYVYQVTGNKVVEPTDFSVIAPSTEPILSLITCTPPGTSWKRLVVTAKQIEPAVVAKQPAQAAPVPTDNNKLPGDAPSFWSKITSIFH